MYDMIMTVLMPMGASYVLAKAVIDEWLRIRWDAKRTPPFCTGKWGVFGSN